MLHETSVENALQSFGLTKKETQIYIFLAKHGLQKGLEIASKTRTAKAVVYRTLKILQRKGFVESTLECPVRFKAVPFMSILEAEIKAKHEEAREIEDSKDNLLADWSKINKGEPELQVEKFVTIEGYQKILWKILKMVKETKKQLSTITTINDLLQADRYGILEAIYNHPSKASADFRYITDLSPSDLRSAHFLRRKLKKNIDVRGRNPDVGIRLFPRMVIRDQEEVMLFISSQEKYANSEQDSATCLSTNCKTMIQAFSAVFEELWVNSTDIEKKIEEMVLGKPSNKTQLLRDQMTAKKIYLETLESAKDEVIIVTSSAGLIKLSKQEPKFEKWFAKGVSVKIMAPITTENLQTTRELLRWSEIRHFPTGYFETTIIDGLHLFQFNNTESENGDFKDSLYTNNVEYIKKSKKILSNMWQNSKSPSFRNIDSFAREFFAPIDSRFDGSYFEKKTSFMQNIFIENVISEKAVLTKIETEKTAHRKEKRTPVVWSNTLRFFGCKAFAAIHPPESFALPDMIIGAFHHEATSTFGAENWIIVNLLQENKDRTIYDTVALVQDTEEPLAFRKRAFTGSTAESNILCFKKGEIEVTVRGKTMLAGWTKSIPLGLTGLSIPPSCLLFEGYGDAKSGKFINKIPSGRRMEHWYTGFDAFVTYFHPDSKYIGQGTESFIQTNSMLISRPVKRKTET